MAFCTKSICVILSCIILSKLDDGEREKTEDG